MTADSAGGNDLASSGAPLRLHAARSIAAATIAAAEAR
jgi:hypothetical protein